MSRHLARPQGRRGSQVRKWLLAAAVLVAPLPAAAVVGVVDPSGALNSCSVALKKPQQKPPKRDPWQDQALWECMGRFGYMFCPECQIFGTKGGGLCRLDSENGPDRPACWEPEKSRDDGRR